MNSHWTIQEDVGENSFSPLELEPANETPKEDQTPDFEQAVGRYYRPLYQFALGLSHSESEACDLAQHTFFIWSTKGAQLRDAAKLRAWLFTTLYRAFLQSRRREARFPHFELSEVDAELPEVAPTVGSSLDSAQALEALGQIDEVFRAPVALFYLEDCPYKEIAEILNLPLGTVKSRIARGIAHLQRLLEPAPRSFVKPKASREPSTALSVHIFQPSRA